MQTTFFVKREAQYRSQGCLLPVYQGGAESQVSMSLSKGTSRVFLVAIPVTADLVTISPVWSCLAAAWPGSCRVHRASDVVELSSCFIHCIGQLTLPMTLVLSDFLDLPLERGRDFLWNEPGLYHSGRLETRGPPHMVIHLAIGRWTEKE